MMLVAREKPDSSAHMSPEDQAYFDQVTLHLGSVILATGSVLRRIVKKPFCGKVCLPVSWVHFASFHCSTRSLPRSI
jgi:hypothetical protein